MAYVDNIQDTLDSRDIIARIDCLESDRAIVAEQAENVANDPDNPDHRTELRLAKEEFGEDEAAELAVLLALAAEAESTPDWSHGEALIRDSYFTEYAQDLAEEIGAVDKNARWPMSSIDWDAAAEELKIDYFDVDFDGVTYWIRG